MADLKKVVAHYGMEIIDNVGGGNCMFFAVAQQLQLHDISVTSHQDLRQKIVNYMKDKEYTYGPFIIKENYPTFGDYCQQMSCDGHWGDHVALQAAADMLRVQIRVLTTANPLPTLINPSEQMALRNLRANQPILDIGHLCEMHYVTLIPMAEAEKQQGIDTSGDSKVTNLVNMEGASEVKYKSQKVRNNEKETNDIEAAFSEEKTEYKDLKTARKAKTEQKDMSSDDENSDSENQCYITRKVWKHRKQEVMNYLEDLMLLNGFDEERLERHKDFTMRYPFEDKNVNFGEGYISHKMSYVITSTLMEEMTMKKLKDQRRVYSGYMTIFKVKVEEKLNYLTRKFL